MDTNEPSTNMQHSFGETPLLPTLATTHISVIGLGYVGLPLAVEFGKRFPTVGYDLNQARIDALRNGEDVTFEVNATELKEATQLTFTTNLQKIADCNVYIVAVPTPIDNAKRPDLTPLKNASKTVSLVLRPGDLVIYESTVFPGATEEVCIPILENGSGLTFNKEFSCGYSPERINPGDKKRRLQDIIKVTSGSTVEAAELIDALYSTIITAGTFRASSIKVAEAAKVIENTQRDVNIALINELALIFNKLQINTQDVLAAAATKWNFLSFQPGLVGGHCIGVDPYYLTHKAQELGYHPEIILAGRRLNDNMGTYIVSRVVKKMMQKEINTSEANVLVLGLTFKENCPDLRNTKVIDIIEEFKEYGIIVDVYDPWVSKEEAFKEYGIELCPVLEKENYDAIVIAVAHQQFLQYSVEDLRTFCKQTSVIYDVKGVYPFNEVDDCL